MSLDLSKLPEAPWRVVGFEPDDRHDFTVANSIGWPLLLAEQDTAGCEAAVRFAVLARNAFDVMMRRQWFPRFCGTRDGEQRWVAYSWAALCNLRDATAVNLTPSGGLDANWVFADPFTAIVEADRWYKENVEKGVNLPHAGSGGKPQ